jgi:hypothetical protein
MRCRRQSRARHREQPSAGRAGDGQRTLSRPLQVQPWVVANGAVEQLYASPMAPRRPSCARLQDADGGREGVSDVD